MSDTKDTRGQSDLDEAVTDAADAVAVHARELGELIAQESDGENVGLAQLMDVPVHVTIEVGRTRLPLGALTRLNAGSVLELDRKAHEPADILVNGKIVAHGENVTIGVHYGVRVTSVES